MGATLSVWRQGCRTVQHGSVTCERTTHLLQNLAAGGHCCPEQALSLLLAADRLCDLMLRLVAVAGLADDDAVHQLIPLYLGYRLANALTAERHAWLAASRHAPVTALIDQLWQRLEDAAEGGGPTQELLLDVSSQRQLCESLRQARSGGLAGNCQAREAAMLAHQYVHAPLPGEQLVVYLDTLYPGRAPLPAVACWWRGEDTGLVLPHVALDATGGAVADTWFGHLRDNGYEPFVYDAQDPAACLCALIEQADQLRNLHQRVVNGQRSYPLSLPIAVSRMSGRRPRPSGLSEAGLTLPVPPQAMARTAGPVCSVPLPALPAFWSLEAGEFMAPIKTIDFWFQYLVETNFCLRPRIGSSGDLGRLLFANSFDSMYYRDCDPAADGRIRSGAIIPGNEPLTLLAPVLANSQGINLLLTDAAFSRELAPELQAYLATTSPSRQSQRLTLPLVLAVKGGECVPLAEHWLADGESRTRVFYPWDANSTVMVMNQLFRERGDLAAVVTPTAELPVCSSGRQAFMAAEEGAVWLLEDEMATVQLLALGATAVQAASLAAGRLRAQGQACALLAILEPTRFLGRACDGLDARVESRLFVTHTDSKTLQPALACAMRGMHAHDVRWLLLGGQADDIQSQSQVIARAITALSDDV